MAGLPPQAGVLEGASPVAYNASDPITLFIIQVSSSLKLCAVATRSICHCCHCNGDAQL